MPNNNNHAHDQTLARLTNTILKYVPGSIVSTSRPDDFTHMNAGLIFCCSRFYNTKDVRRVVTTCDVIRKQYFRDVCNFYIADIDKDTYSVHIYVSRLVLA